MIVLSTLPTREWLHLQVELYQMMESPLPSATYVHARALAHRIQPFEDLSAWRLHASEHVERTDGPYSVRNISSDQVNTPESVQLHSHQDQVLQGSP